MIHALSLSHQSLFGYYPSLPLFLKSRNGDILLSRENTILVLIKNCSLESADRKTTCIIPCTRVLSVLSFMKERGIMSRQQRLIQLPLLGTILLCVLVGVYLLAWKRF